jgi:hypothetical protein
MNSYRVKEILWAIIFVLYCIMALAGCSTQSYRMMTPYEVSNVPVDCLNRSAITNYLDSQKTFKPTTEREHEQVNSVKYKLWQIRAVCQSM